MPPEPDRITEADIEAALAAPSIVGDGDDADFKQLVKLAGKELMRRFQEEPSSLPGTFVIKLFLDGSKAVAAGDLPDPDDLGSVDLFKSLSVLPPEAQIEVLAAEIDRLRGLHDRCVDLVNHLKGEIG